MWKRVYLIFYQHRFITFKNIHVFEYFLDTIYTADIHVYKETEDQNKKKHRKMNDGNAKYCAT